MIVTGTLIEVGNTVQITDKFCKREFVVKTLDQYPQELLMQLTQNNVNLIEGIKIGETVEVSINLNGSSYTTKEGVKRWFVNLTAWKINYQDETMKAVVKEEVEEVNQSGDLPF